MMKCYCVLANYSSSIYKSLCTVSLSFFTPENVADDTETEKDVAASPSCFSVIANCSCVIVKHYRVIVNCSCISLLTIYLCIFSRRLQIKPTLYRNERIFHLLLNPKSQSLLSSPVQYLCFITLNLPLFFLQRK